MSRITLQPLAKHCRKWALTKLQPSTVTRLALAAVLAALQKRPWLQVGYPISMFKWKDQLGQKKHVQYNINNYIVAKKMHTSHLSSMDLNGANFGSLELCGDVRSKHIALSQFWATNLVLCCRARGALALTCRRWRATPFSAWRGGSEITKHQLLQSSRSWRVRHNGFVKS